MKKLKKIWKRVGSIFALAVVLIPVLLFGASADTIYDGIQKPEETAGGSLMNVTWEEAAAIMQGMTNGDQYVKDFYATLHERSEDFNVSDYGAVAFTRGTVGLDGDQLCAVSDRYLRKFSTNGDVLNVGYGNVQWDFSYYNTAADVGVTISGRGDCFVTLRPYGQQDWTDITLNDTANLNDRWDRITWRYRADHVDTSGSHPVTYYWLDSIVMRERGTGENFVMYGGVEYVENLTIAFRWVVPDTPSYMISALLGFDITDIAIGQAAYDLLWDTPHDTVAGVLAGRDLGYNIGFAEGAEVGFTEGSSSMENIWKLVVKVYEAPSILLNSMLNFDLFGINLFWLVRLIFTLFLVVIVGYFLGTLAFKIWG